MQTILTIDLIAADPAIRKGRPCVAGTGLRVTDLVMAHLFHGRTPDEIAADYELALSQVCRKNVSVWLAAPVPHAGTPELLAKRINKQVQASSIDKGRLDTCPSSVVPRVGKPTNFL